MSDISRKDELLIDHALHGLSDAEQIELLRIDKKALDENKNPYEFVAASLKASELTFSAPPAGLMSKLKSQAQQFVDPAASPSLNGSRENGAGINGRTTWNASDEALALRSEFNYRESIAWVTVAASLLGLFFVWDWSNNRNTKFQTALKEKEQLVSDLNSDLRRQKDEVTKLQQEKPELLDEIASLNDEAQQLRRKLNPDGAEVFRSVAQRENVIRWEWTDLKKAGVSGEVVWDQERQEGAMRFVGLEKNDPTVKQYQLWILDGRDNPVDGGVFDIQSGQETFVAIRPALIARPPNAFAITEEEPNGVVVSDQKRLPLIAKAE